MPERAEAPRAVRSCADPAARRVPNRGRGAAWWPLRPVLWWWVRHPFRGVPHGDRAAWTSRSGPSRNTCTASTSSPRSTATSTRRLPAACWRSTTPGPSRRATRTASSSAILYFELGYEIEGKQVEYFRKAKYWLDRYKAISKEEWDAVDDRLLDIDDFFEEQGIEVEATVVETAPAGPVRAPHVVEEIDDHGPMMLVAAGTFLFGPAKEEVNLAAFYIDKFPVTNREYEAFCRATGYRWPKFMKDERFNDPDGPVVGVSLADAQRYCRWVGKSLPTRGPVGEGVSGLGRSHLPVGRRAAHERTGVQRPRSADRRDGSRDGAPGRRLARTACSTWSATSGSGPPPPSRTASPSTS